MIGEHSDFMEIKKLIKDMMSKNVLDSGMKKLFGRILNKYISSMEQANGNVYLIGWAKEETRKLSNQ